MTDEMAGTAAHNEPWRLSKIEHLFRRTSLFRWTLRNAVPGGLITSFHDHWRGKANSGAKIMTSGSHWRLSGNDFDRFDWLRDLRSYGGSQARSRARMLISTWIEDHESWDYQGWHPEIMASRLANLVFSYGWYGSSAEETFQNRLAGSLRLQARCLALDWQRLYRPEARLTALKGLFVAEAALGVETPELDALIDLLVPLVEGRLNADGGHISRMPNVHLGVMRDLIEIRAVGASRQITHITWLDMIIAKMAAICRMWRHADGQFARFNGAGLTDPEIIEETLTVGGQKGKVLQQARDTGFLRFSSGRSTVIMDCGTPNTEAAVTSLSSLAFEFSVGQHLLVVNPGQTAPEANLQRLLESTKAHSTLTLDGHNSSEPAVGRIAKVSNLKMGAAEGGFLTTASHNGYETSHGILHHRTLYLATGGASLRGSDRLDYTGAPGEIGRLAILRFHLHPRVSAAMLNDQRVLIKIRGNRAGWLFRSNGTVTLDNSLFFDLHGRMNCQQIVVTMPIDNIRTVGTIDIKWAFHRSDPS